MAKGRRTYRKKSKRIIAREVSACKAKRVKVKIDGNIKDLFWDYVTFLKSLDRKEVFSEYSSTIDIKGAQWNAIRRKHLTASQIKRVYKWTEKTRYIYDFLSQYISEHLNGRGLILEKVIIRLINMSGYELQYCNQIWIHKQLIWLSCTTDGVIVHNGKLVAAVEI